MRCLQNFIRAHTGSNAGAGKTGAGRCFLLELLAKVNPIGYAHRCSNDPIAPHQGGLVLFSIKKFLSAFILPPGCFVLLLLATGLRFLLRGRFAAGLTNLLLCALLWAASTSALGNLAIGSLEAGLSIPAAIQGDVIILLGGGTHPDVPDLTGIGSPTGDMAVRLLTAVRAQRMLDVPIIVSGGSSNPGMPPEAPTVARLLADLGVAREHLIEEAGSRDTVENAAQTLEVLRQRGFQNPVLVTSAYHMKRSLLSFEKRGIHPLALPCDFRTNENRIKTWRDYVPSMNGLVNLYRALHEYLGLLYYRVFL